jgi:two-component system, LytTR family, sensor kinase
VDCRRSGKKANRFVSEKIHFVSTFLLLRLLRENPAYFSGMKRSWYSKKWVIILIHIAAWALLFSLPHLLSSSGNDRQPPLKNSGNNNAVWYFSILMNATWVAFFYFNAYVLVPKFIYKKKYWQYALIQLLSLAWLLVEASLLFKLFFSPEHFRPGGLLFINFFIYLFFFALSLAYQLINEKVKSDKLNSERENENLKTELSLLRSQVSPHFMFNVLNNMVALARKQSDQLEPSLIKLSSLMRYMLYEADESKVALEKEIEYLQSYIDLQQQRFGKNVKVNVTVDAPDSTLEIEPMLLIPFVENAFKHGTGMIEDAQIDIDLRAKNDVLQFMVRNKYNSLSEEVKDKTSGIGLANVKRRLNLLYGKNYSLMISEQSDWFVVSLQLNLH